MSVPVLHESQVQAVDLPGRKLSWLVGNEQLRAKNCSVCSIVIPPGEKAKPAHSHPKGEEVVYILSGSGRALVAGEVAPVRAGSIVVFPKAAVHMLHNTGKVEMKAICFFAPATNLTNYKMFDEVDFPDVNGSELVTSK
jgi:mannose-6-phosphate isomerase-like protein (cupin superfamily)